MHIVYATYFTVALLLNISAFHTGLVLLPFLMAKQDVQLITIDL